MPAIIRPNYRPEDYGTDNTLALAQVAAAVLANGGGIVSLMTGKEYIVGVQRRDIPNGYLYEPLPLFDVTKLPNDLVIEGNGAIIRCATGMRFGSFNPDGTPMAPAMPYEGPGIASPYRWMIRAINCQGNIRIDDLELDGNIAGQVIGGQWGDTGIQLPMDGIYLGENMGGITLNRINAHHHGCDGMQINGMAKSETDPMEKIVVNESHFDSNGRLGVAIVGGRDITFNGGSANWNAAQDRPGGGTPVRSNPASGFDLEAEGGKIVRDVTFNDMEMIGNQATAIVADNTNCDRVTVNRCKLVQTHKGGYALWPKIPNFTLNDTTVAGTIVFARDTFVANHCTFTNSPTASPTGVVGCVNNLLFEAADPKAKAIGCDFINDCGDGNLSATAMGQLIDCTAKSLSGVFTLAGTHSGKTAFIMKVQNGNGSIYGSPAGAIPGTEKHGTALDNWSWIIGGVETIYSPTNDKVTGAELKVVVVPPVPVVPAPPPPLPPVVVVSAPPPPPPPPVVVVPAPPPPPVAPVPTPTPPAPPPVPTPLPYPPMPPVPSKSGFPIALVIGAVVIAVILFAVVFK